MLLVLSEIRAAVASISIVLCAAFAFNQFRLHQAMASLRAEVLSIITHLEFCKDDEGSYPAEIADGAYHDVTLRQFVRYTVSKDGKSFGIIFHPCRGKWLCRCLPHGVYHGYESTAGYYFSDD